ncbi:hypothetical protein EDC04DRAFT_2601577 [Pisolithus marmoratus]|nr:hypothetical protein EDC04DRAFT_2601577 [Pisolithus marmoratus]
MRMFTHIHLKSSRFSRQLWAISRWRLLYLVRAIEKTSLATEAEAITRVEYLATRASNDDDEQAIYLCTQILGVMHMKKGNYGRGIPLIERAKDVAPKDKQCPSLRTILLVGIRRGDPGEQGNCSLDRRNVLQPLVWWYSTALSISRLFVMWSRALAAKGLCEDALQDANEACVVSFLLRADSSYPWGYETKYVTLHAVKRYDEAIDAFGSMLQTIEHTHDPAIRLPDIGSSELLGHFPERPFKHGDYNFKLVDVDTAACGAMRGSR